MLKIVEKNVEDLIPYDNNARHNEEAVEYVANSIKEFGFKVPCVVDKNNVIIAGHTRLEACKRLGLKKVPCIIADDLSEEQVKAFRLADNKTAEISTWDDELLELELKDLAGFDMGKFGFDLQEDLEEEIAKTKEQERKLKRMELKAFEHYDYLVFVFNNQHDFLRAAQEFKLEKVDAGYSVRKLGIGRVLKGHELIKKLEHKDSDFEQK